MKRRALLTGLFAIGATVALADPAQAIRPTRRGRMRGWWTRFRGEDRRPRISRRRSAEPRMERVSYTQPAQKPVRRDFAQYKERPAPPDPYAATRSVNGRLTEDQVHTFRRKYDQQQSRQAMRSALGDPAEHTWGKDRWRIQRTDIYGKPAEDGWFEADYGLQAPLQGWEAKTVRPPKANW